MIAGARVEVAPFKRDPMDFVLWKPSDAETPGWDSPWGRGRPGWHIECSAMSHELLGPAFDIHGGGIDLQFPHHENEIAQSRCAHPEDGFAKVWMHNEMLQVEGKKMSKSLGNFFTVRDLLDQGVPGEVIRFVLLGTHYSKPMDWTRRKAMEAKSALMEMALMLGSGGEAALASLKPGKPLPEVVDALADDLNTHLALSLLRRKSFASRYTAKERMDLLENLYASQQLLGFDLKKAAIAMSAGQTFDGILGIVREIAGDGPAKAIARRIDEARNRKDFAEADRLRSGLEEAGVIVKSTKEGTLVEIGLNFDPAKLEALE
jgi:cysteinyl-tRNA synthetase